MLSVDEALSRVLAQVNPFPAEYVALYQAHGRFLAEDLVAPVDLPPWDNSAMDGYAVRAADTGEGAVLRLNEVIAAGKAPSKPVLAGTASAIMTGAPVPKGATAVVMVEDSDGALEGTVTLRRAATTGDHIRRRGEDVARGTIVLRRGARLHAAQLGMVASLGLSQVPVVRRPNVAILSTGDEVVPAGTPLSTGKIYSSNNASLGGLVREAGGSPVDLGNAPDDLDLVTERLRAALEADVVLTTGGVSVGAFDFVKEAYGRLGVEMDFWKVRMKPGKPLAFGWHPERRIPLFGLPGNPVSCMVNFLQFVRPWLLTAQGVPNPFLPVVEAFCAHPFPSGAGRVRFERVVLESRKGNLWCRSTGTQSSGALHSMVLANGIVIFGENAAGAQEGETVRVQLLDTRFLERSDPGYGW